MISYIHLHRWWKHTATNDLKKTEIKLKKLKHSIKKTAPTSRYLQRFRVYTRDGAGRREGQIIACSTTDSDNNVAVISCLSLKAKQFC